MATDRGMLKDPAYTPSRLLNRATELLGSRNDSHLARQLGTYVSMVYRLRSREDPLTAWMMVAIMDATGLTIDEVRRLAGVPRTYKKGIEETRRPDPHDEVTRLKRKVNSLLRFNNMQEEEQE